MKIIDGFLFFNELELLEIRLEELFDVVDYFVICECTKTHQNKQKPLFYLENKDRFKKFESKIIHHIFDPSKFTYSWYIENEQRNCIKNAKFEIEKEDIFLLSDADEIMKKESVAFIKDNPNEFKIPRTSIMQMSYGYIDSIVYEPWHHKDWRGTVILPYHSFIENNLNYWRSQKDLLSRYENSGWHLSFLGGIERVKTKLESYAHSEFNNKNYTDDKIIKKRLMDNLDPLGREEFKLKKELDIEKFPKSSLKFKNLFSVN